MGRPSRIVAKHTCPILSPTRLLGNTTRAGDICLTVTGPKLSRIPSQSSSHRLKHRTYVWVRLCWTSPRDPRTRTRQHGSPKSGRFSRNTGITMTRRDFAGLPLFILLGAVRNQGALQGFGAPTDIVRDHVEIRRLFQFTTGAIQLDESGRAHIHNCNICQGMAYAFLQSAKVTYSSAFAI